MPNRGSHSISKSKLGCMCACMLCSERNLGFKAEKGIMARCLPAGKTLRLQVRTSRFSSACALPKSAPVPVSPPTLAHSCSLPRIPVFSKALSMEAMDRLDTLQAMHETIARSCLDVEMVLRQSGNAKLVGWTKVSHKMPLKEWRRCAMA